MTIKPELVKPSQYPRLFCPHCGCVNDVQQNINNFRIEEAWRIIDNNLYFSSDYPAVTLVEFYTIGFCLACGVRFDMTLEHMHPSKKKKKDKSTSQ